ncbi:MAG: valine--tRNA ligase, partial [Ruminococcaceae bacterium]|nr:valine--tRNA ligase [Oscillospiraceae bacterium]
RKMSKSLGNGIDPLEVIEKYGADALRYALATGNSPGNDMRFSDEKIEAARNFNNKIWNASRFVLMNLDIESVKLPDASELEIEDKWILSLYNKTVKEVCANLDNYELGIALAKLYDFIWDIFCDWYIELLKPRFADKGSKSNLVAQNVITYVLSNTLKLLHPFMPFITEEIWQTLPHENESIMVSDYPVYDPALDFENEEIIMDRLIAAIRAIRNRRNEMNVPPSKKAALYIASSFKDTYNEKTEAFFIKLASASQISYVDSYEDENAVQIITDSAKIYIPLGDLVDFEKEKERLEKEKAKEISEIERIEKKLSNEGFVSKAPQAVIDGEKAKLVSHREILSGVEKALKKLNEMK